MNIRMKIRLMLKKVRDDPVIKKKLSIVTVAAVLLISISLVKTSGEEKNYILNSTGNVVALERNGDELSEFKLSLRIENEDEIKTYSIIPGSVTKREISERDELYDLKVIHEAEINSMISEIERTHSDRVELPEALSDGTAVIWGIANERDMNWMYIILFYLFLLPLIVIGTKAPNERSLIENKRKIVKCIPRFTNQLLLLMNAGLILSDAFKRIGESYELIPAEKRGLFETEVAALCEICSSNGVTTSVAVSMLASKYNVKELMRIGTFMSENEKRGSDIVSSLARESAYLWEERKVRAKEQGKSIDTKMAYPLAILLILLIVITMAPVIISM